MTRDERIRLLPAVIALARRAGHVVLEHYAGDFGVRRKTDASPVTEADEASERTILAGLRADRKSTRLNSSHSQQSRMPSSA